MKITTNIPSKEYPYLAVWVGGGGIIDSEINIDAPRVRPLQISSATKTGKTFYR